MDIYNIYNYYIIYATYVWRLYIMCTTFIRVQCTLYTIQCTHTIYIVQCNVVPTQVDKNAR